MQAVQAWHDQLLQQQMHDILSTIHVEEVIHLLLLLSLSIVEMEQASVEHELHLMEHVVMLHHLLGTHNVA